MKTVSQIVKDFKKEVRHYSKEINHDSDLIPDLIRSFLDNYSKHLDLGQIETALWTEAGYEVPEKEKKFYVVDVFPSVENPKIFGYEIHLYSELNGLEGYPVDQKYDFKSYESAERAGDKVAKELNKLLKKR